MVQEPVWELVTRYRVQPKLFARTGCDGIGTSLIVAKKVLDRVHDPTDGIVFRM
jgi:hypothetical protein